MTDKDYVNPNLCRHYHCCPVRRNPERWSCEGYGKIEHNSKIVKETISRINCTDYLPEKAQWRTDEMMPEYIERRRR